MSNAQMKIFIASSIVEFERERDIIENYLWRKNTGKNIDVIPLRCENIDPAMSVTRKEDDYCNYISDSDVCLFILGNSVGKYTIEEYDFAQELVKNGKPIRIIAFCKGNKSGPFYSRVNEDKVPCYDYTDEKSLLQLLEKSLRLPSLLPCEQSEENSVYVFLASSIKEDEKQQLRIENFIWHMNLEFTHKYNVSVRPLFGGQRAQSDLNAVIEKSAMCFFIIFGNVENDVLDELKLAKKRLDENKSPRIYVYFKTVNGDEAQSVTHFKEYLDGELKHFYGLFNDLDTIKLRILLNLAILKDGSKEVVFKDGKCFFGENLTLDVHKVSEFVNNKKLTELKAEFSETSKQFRELKVDYDRDPSNEKICKAYYTLANRYDSLKNSIASLEDDIFSVSLSMSRDETSDDFTEKQRRAYKLFMDGDVEKAIAVLDMEDSINAYIRAAKRAKQAAINVIAEGRQKINFIKTMHLYADRDKIIRQTYEQLIPIATEQQAELGIYNEYALFLKTCERHGEALEQATKLQNLYQALGWSNQLDIAENLTLLALIYADLSDRQQQTIECSLKAIEIREKALAVNGYDEANYIGLARTCKAIGDIYRRANTPDLAEKYLSRAEFLFAELEKNTDKYVTEQAESFIKRGINFAEQYLLGRAFTQFGYAVSIWERHHTDDPHALYVKSSAYQNQASQLKKEGRFHEAIEKFNDALAIRKELTELNPARYTATLAYTYQGLGNVYRAMNMWDEAIAHFNEALKMRIGICAVNAAAHEVELSDSYIKICGTLLDKGCPEEAMENLKKGYEIRKRLYGVTPKTYERWYAQTLFEFGRYYEQTNDTATAEDYYNQAFDIRTKISTQNLEPNIEGLHDSFTKMKQLYGDGFKSRLTQAQLELYDKLYSFEAVDADTGERLTFKTSYKV